MEVSLWQGYSDVTFGTKDARNVLCGCAMARRSLARDLFMAGDCPLLKTCYSLLNTVHKMQRL